MMAAGLIPAIAALGSAIDIGRAYIVKSQLQAGVDAAALAGARAFGVDDKTPQGRDAQVKRYFYGNFPQGYMGSKDVDPIPTFSTDQGINVTSVTADTVMPFSFMRIFGFTQQTIHAVAKAELQPRPLEVMMVLDNTGSMRFNLTGGQTRITALKAAANDFVDIVHQGATLRRDLALGIIPYDVTVNVGKLLSPDAVVARDGFNSGDVYKAGDWPANKYAWKGCVMNDTTVRDVSSNRLTSEPGAWDLTRTLPNEGGNPKVAPYFIPPMYVPFLEKKNVDVSQVANKDGDFYRIAPDSFEQRNNLYRLDKSSFTDEGAWYLSNSTAYRSYLYDYYIGLNNGDANKSDDVIRKRPTNNPSYYDPSTGSRNTTNWYVDWTRIPHYYETSYWSNPADAIVNKNGGRVDNINSDITPMATPNWQCPQQAMPIAYGREKSAYTTYINGENAAIYPGNGTIHHSGLLWAYRMLVRDDFFRRDNPTKEQPRRAIVFMTDGINDISDNQNGYFDRTFSWYGRWSDNSISTNASDGKIQMLRRFSKTCANIQRENNPPRVYIIALVANSTDVNTAFDQCAPGRVYRTSSTAGLREAFKEVASELVDLHLVQ